MPRRDDDYYDDDRDAGYGEPALEPHRGTMILILGILALITCQLIGPFAWAMGGSDLKKMRAGIMDDRGYQETQIGYILGIVATVLIGISLLMMLMWLLFVFVIIGAGAAGAAKG